MAREKHILLKFAAVRSDSSPISRCWVYFRNKISDGIDVSVVFLYTMGGTMS
jgi:hypothetical protein